MIELHGWLSIQETYEDEDLFSKEYIDKIMQKVKEVIQSSACGIEIHYMNGVPFVNNSFYSNHRTKEVDAIIETYKNISKIATGSYGKIYLHDDEDVEHYNEFQMYVFKKGDCTCKIDQEFSPCIPMIESGTVIN